VATHRLDDAEPHAFWDNSHPARIRVEPGDDVVFETLEGTGQISPDSPDEALATLDPTKIHPMTGSVYVEGAEPGDTLVVDVITLEHRGWGWNGVIPGFERVVVDVGGLEVVGEQSNAQRAIRYMIDHLARDQGLSREQAYCLCGAAVDLKISEVVDEPNWIVSAYLPLAILDS
jgi:acetamidase/formamidase